MLTGGAGKTVTTVDTCKSHILNLLVKMKQCDKWISVGSIQLAVSQFSLEPLHPTTETQNELAEKRKKIRKQK